MASKIEYLLALGLILWGVVLLNPFSSAFGTSPTFSALAKIAGEANWGIMYIMIGIISVGVAGIGAPNQRQYALWLDVFGYAVLAAFYFFGNPLGTGYVPYLILALIAMVLIPNGVISHDH
jgi:hypothetical protein